MRNGFIDNLGIKLDVLKDAWRTAEQNRERLVDIIKAMGVRSNKLPTDLGCIPGLGLQRSAASKEDVTKGAFQETSEQST